MSLEKWVEYGWLRREPTSPGEIKDLLGIVDRASRIQRSMQYRPIFDLSQLSTRRLPSRQLLFAPQDIAPSRKPVITSKQSSPSNSP